MYGEAGAYEHGTESIATAGGVELKASVARLPSNDAAELATTAVVKSVDCQRTLLTLSPAWPSMPRLLTGVVGGQTDHVI